MKQSPSFGGMSSLPSGLTPQAFVDKWRHTELKERAACQEHFLDLCHLIGHPTPAADDPAGEHFAFEYGLAKQDGGQGFADVFKRGYFGWEYKGKHANLDKAYGQLLQYRSDLLNPPLLIVCDMDRIIVHTNFTNTVHQVHTIALNDLLTADGLQKLRAIFSHPDFFKAAQTTEQVTREAAQEFAHLAELLRAYGTPPQDAAHFLIRCLFCLFAEDVGLLPDRLFTRIVTQAHQLPKSFVPQVQQLFRTMSTGGFFGVDVIKYFDGRLFDHAVVFDLDSDSLDILRRVSALDWSSIEPSIFGTLFTRSLDPAKRAQLGAQYTRKEDILLILEPVLMAPLRRRWAEVQTQAHALAAQRKAADGAKRGKLEMQLRDLLIGFATELAQISVLDPACGSGNFLYVALVLLLDLWKEVSNFMAELGYPRLMPLPDVAPSPAQLHGIEKDEYAHELARTTIWIGYIQWFVQNGFGFPPEPILRPIDTVVQMDAILTLTPDPSPCEGEGDAQHRVGGEAHEPEWPAVDVIVGNPPFLGGKRLRAELGDDYVDALFALYEGRIPHECDLVSYWFEKARATLEQGMVKRVGLLATQAIRAGANRRILERIKSSGDIFYAQADRPWILDGAQVRVSMVGFDNGSEKSRLLNENKDDSSGVALANARVVSSINANLTSEADVTQAQRLAENANICFQGPVKVGAFEIEDDFAQEMLQAPNPNRRPNSEVVKPWMNASDVTGHARRMWIIDFGEMGLEEAALFEAPFEYVKKNIKPFRDNNNDRQRRTFWWRLGRSGGDLRNAKAGKSRLIVTPRVAKHRMFVWTDVELVPDSRLFAFARDDDYFFGTLHSRIHEVWSLATSSRHGVGNDPTYNNTTCFETFPFPWPPGHEPSRGEAHQSPQHSGEGFAQNTRSINSAAIADKSIERNTLANASPLQREQAIANAARELVQLRETQSGTRTLTQLYNERPTWLDNAHRKLDAAVCAAYGWPVDLRDDEILTRLLALNLERATG